MTNRHLEIPVDDIERAKKFYTELFGWKVQKAEGPMEYWLIATTNEKGEEGVGGGMMRRQDLRALAHLSQDTELTPAHKERT